MKAKPGRTLIPPGQLPGMPRPVVGCLWALAYIGPLAAPAGAPLGGFVGVVGAGICWALAKTGRQRAAVLRGSAGDGRCLNPARRPSPGRCWAPPAPRLSGAAAAATASDSG
jgi:hypothetical protein